MDSYKVMWYLLSDFTKYGIAYPRSAKEIAVSANIDLSEAYATLVDLREKGLIWRVGSKYKYRFGLKEGTHLDNLVQLYNSLSNGLLLPSHLRIESHKCDELLHQKELQKEISQKEYLEQNMLIELSSNTNFLSQRRRREEVITESITRILNFYSKCNRNSKDEIMNFLKIEFESILPFLFGVEKLGGK